MALLEDVGISDARCVICGLIADRSFFERDGHDFYECSPDDVSVEEDWKAHKAAKAADIARDVLDADDIPF